MGNHNSGRKTTEEEVQKWLADHCLPALEVIDTLSRGKQVEDSVRFQASRALVEQAIGKPPSRVDVIVGTDTSLLDLLGQLRGANPAIESHDQDELPQLPQEEE